MFIVLVSLDSRSEKLQELSGNCEHHNFINCFNMCFFYMSVGKCNLKLWFLWHS